MSEKVEKKEQQEKNRKTKKNKVILLKNIKYNDKRYKIGEEIEIGQGEVEFFVKSGIIKG